jgi:hypothetical protein
MTDNTRAVVDYAYDDNASEMRNALYGAIHDKVSAHLAAHKQSIAQNLIKGTQSEESFESEESEEQTQE